MTSCLEGGQGERVGSDLRCHRRDKMSSQVVGGRAEPNLAEYCGAKHQVKSVPFCGRQFLSLIMTFVQRATKLNLPAYHGLTEAEAINDFRNRILNNTSHYETMSEADKDFSWIKTVDGGKQVIVVFTSPLPARPAMSWLIEQGLLQRLA
eukprot:759865-Hanusia_phi.AAC.2